MNSVNLTKKLIAIPSYVDGDTSETKIADFICSYLTENLPWLKIEKQFIDDKRYNIIALPKNKTNVKLLFSSHMDTVKPAGDTKLRLTAIVKDEKIYGLGACDMKAGLALSIVALERSGPKSNAGLMFTCDEEYYFAGIRRFMDEPTPRPELVIFPEPSELLISNGSRGIVEIEFDVIGRTAHAGRPTEGINAIEKAVELVEQLKQELLKYDNSELGKTTVCLSALEGGRLLDGKISIQANAIADVAKVLLDIRTAGVDIDSKLVRELIGDLAKDFGVEIANVKANLNYKPYLIKKEYLRNVEISMKDVLGRTRYLENYEETGIGEATLIYNKLGWNAVNLGPVGNGTSHKIEESVDTASMEKLEKIFISLIKSYI